MKTSVLLASALLVLLVTAVGFLALHTDSPTPSADSTVSELSLITATPEEGFQVALRLSRLGVTETQPDREVLHAQRPEYANDAEALIAASHVVAVHFHTVAAANNYWR